MQETYILCLTTCYFDMVINMLSANHNSIIVILVACRVEHGAKETGIPNIVIP